jgi:hypothetical protein
MRHAPMILAVVALVLTAACSPHDDQGARADAKNAGADFKSVGHDAAKDLRKLAAEAKIEAHKLAADTRGAAHDVTKHDHNDDKNS